MAISGLVLTLSDDAAGAAVLSVLSTNPLLTLGDRFGRRVAVVAETPSAHADRDLFDELRGTPGITQVDVTFVHLDPELSASKQTDQGHSVEELHAHH